MSGMLMSLDSNGNWVSIGEIKEVSFLKAKEELDTEFLSTVFGTHEITFSYDSNPFFNKKLFNEIFRLEKWEITMLKNPRKKNRALKRRIRKFKEALLRWGVYGKRSRNFKKDCGRYPKNY